MKKWSPGYFEFIIVLIITAITAAVLLVFIVSEADAQGEYPLADGVCGPVPTGTVVTVQSFVARTGPMTQAPGSGSSVPAGRSFPVYQIVCDEGVTFVAVNWDGQQ
ncbi:hypothetical protein KBD71_04130, partial [Candidatus Woesebacteria bacterium]|nr:hypothetical protein [Candidatus Woesebacteria bacterium]